MDADVVVVGGGFVGLHTAYRLHKGGFRVVVVGGEAPRKGASWGNAGLIHQGSATTVPEIIGFWRVVRLALRRGSYISSNPWIALRESLPGGWIWRYARSLNREEIARRSAVLAQLIPESKRLWLEIIRGEGLDAELKEKGSLEAYFSEELFSLESRVVSEEASRLGYRVQIFDGVKCREVEPLLRENVVGGIYYSDDAWVNPSKTLNSFISALQRLGVSITWERVKEVKEDGDGLRVLAESGEMRAGRAVIAAGAWTGRLLHNLGVDIPLIAGRGYLALTEPVRERLSMPVFYADEKVIAGQTTEGNLRLTSYFELNNPDAPLDRSKIVQMAEKMREALKIEGNLRIIDEWVGSRPCVYDGLPVIGRVGKRGLAVVATGMCRLGLTLSPIGAKLVEDIITGQENPILQHFSPTRFS
ncbi:MAG: FAD-dependent oxidoreductase [Nitrososphaerota archaeon]